MVGDEAALFFFFTWILIRTAFNCATLVKEYFLFYLRQTTNRNGEQSRAIMKVHLRDAARKGHSVAKKSDTKHFRNGLFRPA
jgi:hypothetical protein